MAKSINLVHSVLWSPVVLWGMLGLGLYFMIRLRFLPFRFSIWRRVIASLFKPVRHKQALSSFQIIATNLGAVMGIGNMVGVASALLAGGPGSLFWMWLSSFLISTLKYGEILLAMQYRQKAYVHQMAGGPMYYIREGLGSRSLSKLYAVLLVLSSFGIGNMVASRSMADALTYTFDVPGWIWGLVFMALMLVVVEGGLKRVVRWSEWLVPILVVLYCLACIYMMIQYADQMRNVLSDIWNQAMGLRSVAGGTMGMAMKYGMSRGIFSNEAGMGSSTLTHVQSDHDNYGEQAMWGFIEVFLDTIVMCSLSGFVILLSSVPLTITNPVMLLSTAFGQTFGTLGIWFVSVSLVLFGFASIMGWYFYGYKCVEYVSSCESVKIGYRLLFVVSLFIGTFIQSDALWLMSDNFNGLVLWLNVLVLFVLRKEIVQLTNQYLRTGRRAKKQ